ncbi:hypothetical protein HPB52_016322 [Rhipicephalus sanguineus]|uniref:Uncharacterized protein n=1 Tax=Rhipicephalus sanguineus TaxID=34632 RepID=A0A9D4SZ71_RHISA|nr:hypothetical protein HPB52_016322 [Rhipicephalus sanguineus]
MTVTRRNGHAAHPDPAHGPGVVLEAGRMEALMRADPGPDPRVVGPNRGADLARGAGLGTARKGPFQGESEPALQGGTWADRVRSGGRPAER